MKTGTEQTAGSFLLRGAKQQEGTSLNPKKTRKPRLYATQAVHIEPISIEALLGLNKQRRL